MHLRLDLVHTKSILTKASTKTIWLHKAHTLYRRYIQFNIKTGRKQLNSNILSRTNQLSYGSLVTVYIVITFQISNVVTENYCVSRSLQTSLYHENVVMWFSREFRFTYSHMKFFIWISRKLNWKQTSIFIF